ncbi:MAG TPA: UDP-3-O-acyl-N-acetylglucosamine deacetylase [Polyangiaceae bacterium]|nr:UDP-3-O-acyl-N-acetylglucosamine deacetylase [Polyangiaceae bacterium]
MKAARAEDGARVRLEGFALHAGTVTSVTLERWPGPLAFAFGDKRVPLGALSVARTDLGVAVTDGEGATIDLVEHLLAALGGLGIRRGVLMTVEGSELPLLDGGARAFADALLTLAPERGRPELAVARRGHVEWRGSRYDFEVAPGGATRVDVHFEHPVIGAESASWQGDAATFLAAIAPARTFGFASQGEELLRIGRAQLYASPDPRAAAALGSVLVVDDAARGTLAAGELARHKLLDLIGDFTLYGGPPEGHVEARRPGHTATHRIIGEALAAGILSRR